MAPVPRYGSMSDDDKDEQVELLPPHAHAETETSFIGDVDAAPPAKRGGWTKHHCASYTLAALICLLSAKYWHGRASSYDGGDSGITTNGGDVAMKGAHGRVPYPPALSNLDPAADLGFRSTTRKGLASPSEAWGERYSNDGDSEFTPLPTNEWYNNLLSHNAAKDPTKSSEVARVYTIPYQVGVAPDDPPPASIKNMPVNEDGAELAGIHLFLPAMKTSVSNMQMIFDQHNGVGLGTIVGPDYGDEGSVPTSYEVDPDEPLSPLGVSLKWKHANMKSSIVRGMPYGTVRYGRHTKGGRKGKWQLPTITAGNRALTIAIDSDEGDKKMMKCGSVTGKAIHQASYVKRQAPLTEDFKPKSYTVQREVIFHLDQSDFTWVAFFNKPVKVECYSDASPEVGKGWEPAEVGFVFNVLDVLDGDDDASEEDDELVVRLALLNECTTGHSTMKDHCAHLKGLGYETISGKGKADKYLDALRAGSGLYPKSPAVGTEFLDEEEGDGGRATNVVFDWDVTSSGESKFEVESAPAVAATSLRAAALPEIPSAGGAKEDSEDTFVMFALQHHMETLSASGDLEGDAPNLCLHTFHGRTCLVNGATWNMRVEHGAEQSFLADRPPVAEAVPALAEALNEDMQFRLSGNVLRGAADTYFPAKIFARLGRVVEINEELKNLKSGSTLAYTDATDDDVEVSASAAAGVDLPSDEDVEALLDNLQAAVEILLEPGGKKKGGAEAEFLYDASWGGFVNCGCNYTFVKGHADNGTCGNAFPSCPALADVNVNFGNGWYNDHHFHYGYHIYAAAIVAKHRPEWAKKYHERIMLYVRDIANPSPEDEHFPMYRQKDWYLGNSWAAGLMSMELSPHGREQESSSEAIAAFEGIALYGNVMMKNFADDEENLASARLIRNVGELLTAMEVSAANRFWHVWGSKYDEEGATSVSLTGDGTDGNDEGTSTHINTYPKKYSKPVVGMMHETMASFQTWFGPQDVLSYGIQLIPLTAVAERRDDPEWTSILYPAYAESCEEANEAGDGFCEDNGWSILQAGLLAETGKISDALEMASEIPDEVFVSDGGSGNSLSNTLWFISTRKPTMD